MISDELQAILCCPETRQNLSAADASLIGRLNQKIEKKQLRTRGGGAVAQKIEGGLIRADKQFLYPVRNDIPVMLIDEAIPLAGVL